MEEGAVWTVPRPPTGRPRPDVDLCCLYDHGGERPGHGLAAQRLWSSGAPRAAFAAQDQAYGVLAGTRGAWGVLFSLYMMSYEVSEYRFFQYYIKTILD